MGIGVWEGNPKRLAFSPVTAERHIKRWSYLTNICTSTWSERFSARHVHYSTDGFLRLLFGWNERLISAFRSIVILRSSRGNLSKFNEMLLSSTVDGVWFINLTYTRRGFPKKNKYCFHFTISIAIKIGFSAKSNEMKRDENYTLPFHQIVALQNVKLNVAPN